MAYIYDLTDTWNAAGTVFNGIKLNVTNSASAAASKLITLQIGGTEHFSVTKAGVGYFSGNVGIGTTTGGGKVNIRETDTNFEINTSSADASLLAYNRTTSAYKTLKFRGSDFTFNVNDTERMRIDSSGNVGIGTSAPVVRFDVTGPVETTFSPNVYNTALSGTASATSGNAGSGIAFRGYFTGTSFADLAFVSGIKENATDGNYAGALVFGTRPNGSGGGSMERMRIDSSGNVGIGTSSPASLLHVKRGSSATEVYPSGTWASRVINATDASAENGLLVGNRWAANTSTIFEVGSIFGGGSGSWYSYYRIDGSGQSFWGQGGSERMRLNASGFLLVGTTAPMAASGSNEFKITSAGVWPLSLNGNDRGLLVRNSSASSGFYAYFEYNGGTNNGSISWSGGTTAYNTTSDYRLKEIDGPITNSGAYIDALKPVEGWWKADGKRFIGFLAHQVQEVSQTSVVVGEKDGAEMQQMDYSAPELIANLIAEVQSLRARVAQLEGN